MAEAGNRSPIRPPPHFQYSDRRLRRSAEPPESPMRMLPFMVAVATLIVIASPRQKPEAQTTPGANKPDRLEWFRDLGFGLFIHWSVDGPLGRGDQPLAGRRGRRLHSPLLRGAAPRLQPAQVPSPGLGRPGEAGRHEIRRVHHQAPLRLLHVRHQDDALQRDEHAVSARHHGRDREGLPREGLAIGLYFSPDDFHYLHQAGRPIARAPHQGVTPAGGRRA